MAIVRVLMAMSGGVDSSMAASLLVEEGHDVTGVHLKLAANPVQAPGHGCCTLDDARDARRVADVLDLPFYVWDLSAAFAERVTDHVVEEYAAGRTPNPCVRCNERVKYAALLARARASGFDALATGHHVRLRNEEGVWRLRRAADPGKDQTYVLHMATQEQLAHSLFPAGEHPKAALRAMAAERGLATAAKPDSYDLCFTTDLGGWLEDRLGVRPGPVVDAEGAVVGAHTGAYRYTVGQRRGLGLAGRSLPLFVTAIAGDRVQVGPRDALRAEEVAATAPTWVADPPPVGAAVGAQVRYRGAALPARVVAVDADHVCVRFESERPEAAAPGQALVLYDADECLGGATIAHAA